MVMNDGRHRLSGEVRKLIVERLKLDHLQPDEIDDEAPLFGPGGASGGLGLDSIDALELVLGVEQRFGVQIENEESGNRALQSVATLCRFIEEHGGSESPGGGAPPGRSRGTAELGGSGTGS
jgi:acyl carrier protein